MAEFVLCVRKSPEGWVVENGLRYGPVFSKQRAVELAEGMAEAMRARGDAVEVVVEAPEGPD